MKHSLAFTSLVSIGVLCFGACSAEDSDPPPVAFPQMTVDDSANAATDMTAAPDTTGGAEDNAQADDGTDPAADSSGTSNSEDEVVVVGLDPGETDEPATDGTPDEMMPDEMTPEEEVPEEPVVEEPPPLTIPDLVGDLDGHLFTVACGDQPNTDDCSGAGWRSNGGQLNQCQGGRLFAQLDFPIAGEVGTIYEIRMHFYGVMEPRNYGNVVTREANGRPSAEAGGTPTPYAFMQAGAGNYLSTGDNNYNTYELHVMDENGDETQVHFLNADTQTGHYTFGISYEKTLAVPGGGTVRLQIQDANCRQIKNCGSGGVPCIGKARTIDISAADPQPGPALQQPGLGLSPEHSGQWFLLDVVDFQARE